MLNIQVCLSKHGKANSIHNNSTCSVLKGLNLHVHM